MTWALCLTLWPKLLLLLGRPADLVAIFDAMGLCTQERAHPKIREILKEAGPAWAEWGAGKLSRKGIYTPESWCDEGAALRIMSDLELTPVGQKTLDEIATIDAAAWAIRTACHPAQSWGVTSWLVSTVTIALALEKHGVLGPALNYARQGTDRSPSRAGDPKPHSRAQAHAVAARVLAKLGNATESRDEFAAAVATCAPPAASARIWLFEALTLRDELRVAEANPGFGWNAEAIRVRRDIAVAAIPATLAELEVMLF